MRSGAMFSLPRCNRTILPAEALSGPSSRHTPTTGSRTSHSDVRREHRIYGKNEPFRSCPISANELADVVNGSEAKL